MNLLISLCFSQVVSTSAFCGKGKAAALALIEKDQDSRKPLQMLGDSFEESPELFSQCEQFTVKLYGIDHVESVNEARYFLFCVKSHQSHQLPPSQNALKQHIKRANYQAALWKRALKPEPGEPSPSGHGWTVTNDSLSIYWTDKEPAPKVLMEYTRCGCKTPCMTKRCSCRSLNLPCTDACQCTRECANRVVHSCQMNADIESDEEGTED